jgi:arylsulfatase A-like enzyme
MSFPYPIVYFDRKAPRRALIILLWPILLFSVACDAGGTRQNNAVGLTESPVPGCDDDNPCTDDSRNLRSCLHTSHADSSDDGDACTADDACVGGVCQGNADDSIATGRPPPNIVIILADDLGYHDIGVHGTRAVFTPEIDALAAKSVRLTNFYVPSPVCSPSRASLLSGRYPDRHGQIKAMGDAQKLGPGAAPREKFLGEFLQEAGYVTGGFGKWHLGFAEGSHPNDRGFDEFYGNPGGGVYWFNEPEAPTFGMYANKTQVEAEGYAATLHVDGAIDFMEEHREGPFFAYIALINPHSPWGSSVDKDWASQEYLDLYPGTSSPLRQNYKAAVSAMDHEIGRLVQALDDLDLADNTLLIFFSDNGGDPGHGADNAPLRGRKGTVYEGGIRVPAVVRWPNGFEGGRLVSVPIVSMDLFSLALSAANVPPPPTSERIIDGLDPTAVIAGIQNGLHDELFFRYTAATPAWAVRRGPMKLIGGALYDLRSDPGETRDVSAQYPELVIEMTESYQVWLTQDVIRFSE